MTGLRALVARRLMRRRGMRLTTRLGTLACALTLIACGGTSHTHDGGSTEVDGGPIDAEAHPRDSGVDGSVLEGTCPDDVTWPSGLPFGAGEITEEGTATVTGVDASGVDLVIGGVTRRFEWAGSGLDTLSAGMEVELSGGPHWSRLTAPEVTLHAWHAVGIGVPRPALFDGTPIEVEGAPPATLAADCSFLWDECGGEDLITSYALDVGDIRLREGESTFGAGYAIHFAGAAGYLGNHGAGTCIGEPSYQASLGVRVDRAAETETCASIEARYEQVLEEKASCEQPSDCRITAGHCGAGIGGCWYAVSGDVSELDTLAERYRDLGCTSVVCRCAAPPESASCVAGRCMAD